MRRFSLTTLAVGIVIGVWGASITHAAEATTDPAAATPTATVPAVATPAKAIGPKFVQPKVVPGPNEPNWADILKQQWGLDIDHDLRNPVMEGVDPAGVFKKAGDGPVTFTPIIALGTEKTTRGGWYIALDRTNTDTKKGKQATERPDCVTLWEYSYRQSESEIKSGQFTPPQLNEGSTSFDPGDQPFGLWVDNKKIIDYSYRCAFSESHWVAKQSPRLAKQPYRAMIYPNMDPKTGQPIHNSYIIGWSYSAGKRYNFIDAVTRIDNVVLQPTSSIPGIVKSSEAKKLKGDFKFTEGPAWNPADEALYFSDIPPSKTFRYKDGKVDVANPNSNGGNGLMFDATGALFACEHNERRVSRAVVPGQDLETAVGRYNGKRFNAPNDLWFDHLGGFYFTDPYYGPPMKLEMDKEAVYYVSPPSNEKAAGDRKVTRIIDNLVKPNGIALSPDEKWLYVTDNGTGLLWRYPIELPGKIGKGERIAITPSPDGMTVDTEGRLYVTGLGGIYVLTSEGKWIGLIGVAEQPSNCTFGGKDMRTLFITARTGLYSIDTEAHGWLIRDLPLKTKK